MIEEQQSLLMKFLFAVVLLLILSLITSVLASMLVRKYWKPWKVAIVMALISVMITLISLRSKSVFFNEEAVGPALVHQIKSEWIESKAVQRQQLDSIHRQFIFINTALNPALVRGTEGMEEDSSLHIITDRDKLSRLLNFLDQRDTLFGVVACDVFFTDSSSDDPALLSSLQSLVKKNKLVLAYNKDLCSSYSSFYNRLDPSCYGDVTKEKEEAFYFSQQLYSLQNVPSFAYAMHLKLQRPEVTPGKYWIRENGRIAFREYIPELNFTDEKALYSDSVISYGIKMKADTALQSITPASVFTLGNVVTQNGRDEMADNLMQNKNSNRAVIFIGNFSDPYTDRHTTAYGTFYGTTILLNNFYSICHNFHAMSAWIMVLYIMTLFIGYFTIYLIIIRRTFRSLEKSGVLHQSNILVKWIVFLFQFVMAEMHFVLLFAMVLLINLCFNKIVNIMGLLYLIGAFSALFKFFVKYYSIISKQLNPSLT